MIVNDLTESYSAEIVGICVFASRAHQTESLVRIQNNYNFHSIIESNMDEWEKTKWPLCEKGMEFVRSVDINSLTHSAPLKKILEPLAGLRAA